MGTGRDWIPWCLDLSETKLMLNIGKKICNIGHQMYQHIFNLCHSGIVSLSALHIAH